MLVDFTKFHNTKVSDGNISVTMGASEFLQQVKLYLEESLHSQIIIPAFDTATLFAIKKIKEIIVTVKKQDRFEQRKLLEKFQSSMSSRLISQQKTPHQDSG
ncbi:T-complex protein 1 subunit eta [Heterocephalus glaber]|uniref:T-complex protein 1 subunit eta n=1 Tax=Heterocephalus glaber TaxID=10181 RepID=G5ARN4_HETGA|nr:T-complex protein 1 subunit eta [Heterocephalus glaber]